MPNIDLINSEINLNSDIIQLSKDDLQNYNTLEVGREIKIVKNLNDSSFFNTKNFQSSVEYINNIHKGSISHLSNNSCSLIHVQTLTHQITKPITLILGLPRPQMLKKILENLAIFPIRELILVTSDMSDESFMLSNVLSSDQICEHVRYGIRQSGIGFFPQVKLFSDKNPINSEIMKNISGFKVYGEGEADFFVKDLANLSIEEKEKFIQSGISVFVGPERGWSNREKKVFEDNNIIPASLGPAIFRVDTSVISFASQISLVWDMLN